ncbi:MAG TPA: hypothetical protein PK331_01480 [Gordonia sp. (in: high G+C Gram-positive bacteria)]|uniref:hypothetical protein n=1 Tax=unclassified Gordonia (in: high G+C Gram-positive bacteria) TaxID=2657482 RepID=UPI000F949E0A|nr:MULTISPECIES: hypothetical protein [unclassified Gordonia (in: high G+C Gram-positive bacteria)]RUP39505.1 MAG: hypothetical protein EKK60_06875 [Gordonia sp. (in: high G+C Gram-positive bacteria)]HNP57586.1 hypothetical protein [Gordonia sp. (in: high G+C Gram-positive bacteria)]HRC49579.1 hypothetical protein [Gordonia sp. (in: high G+C Gram-positive bacteria)]
MRKTVSAIAAAAAVAGTALTAAPALAVTPPTVKFGVYQYRLIGAATHLPPGTKSCGFDRSQGNPGPIIGSMGNDMVTVGKRKTTGDSVSITTKPLPAGRYLVRMSCFVPNPKTGEPEIVAVNEKWLRITSKGTYAPDNQHH